MALRLIRVLCATAFVTAIVGMVVSSIAGNNEGWVIVFGALATVAALVLLAVSASVGRGRLDVFDDVLAERVETAVQRLAATGADESSLRQLVRDAVELGRSAGESSRSAGESSRSAGESSRSAAP